MSEGWMCPGCGRCYSPVVAQCTHCPANELAGTASCADGTEISIGARPWPATVFIPGFEFAPSVIVVESKTATQPGGLTTAGNSSIDNAPTEPAHKGVE